MCNSDDKPENKRYTLLAVEAGSSWPDWIAHEVDGADVVTLLQAHDEPLTSFTERVLQRHKRAKREAADLTGVIYALGGRAAAHGADSRRHTLTSLARDLHEQNCGTLMLTSTKASPSCQLELFGLADSLLTVLRGSNVSVAIRPARALPDTHPPSKLPASISYDIGETDALRVA